MGQDIRLIKPLQRVKTTKENTHSLSFSQLYLVTQRGNSGAPSRAERISYNEVYYISFVKATVQNPKILE